MQSPMRINRRQQPLYGTVQRPIHAEMSDKSIHLHENTQTKSIRHAHTCVREKERARGTRCEIENIAKINVDSFCIDRNKAETFIKPLNYSFIISIAWVMITACCVAVRCLNTNRQKKNSTTLSKTSLLEVICY